ncbi:putative amino-acid permease [Cladorrhinum sp. PSN332]|nr:putative amino-acid permease [Cladorrhinum sp. PSN332]
MASTPPSGPRTEFFQQLKRICVPLSQIAIRSQDKAADSKEILQLVDSLIGLWTAQASKDGSILDDKLADYVFFPLSHLLRSRDHYPMRVIESIIRLLRELVQHGWKAKTSPQLFQQLLVFLSFTISGVPGKEKKQHVPEETILEGFRTLGALITAVDASRFSIAGPPSTEQSTLPALGHSVTVMLDGVTDDFTPPIQLEAVQCLRAVFTKTQDSSVLAQFLPGTVSAFSKRLSPPLEKQTQRRVLVSCLEVLQLVLINVLGDLKVRSLLKELKELEAAGEPQEASSVEKTTEGTVRLSPSWLKATAAQVKIALSAVLKLRSHEAEDVQAAVYKLCIGLLDQCHLSLGNCQSILVETSVMLEDDEANRSRLETSLQDLASIYPELGDSIKSALYNWVTGLPRVMQSSDERVKQLAIRSILRGSKLAAAMQMDSSTLDDSLGDSLRDSIVTLIKGSKPPKVLDDLGAVDLSTSTDLIISGSSEVATYHPILLNSEGERKTRREITSLISNVGSQAQQVKLATAILSCVRDSEGIDQIASYWLAFELLKATYTQSSDLDELFDLSSLTESKQQDQAFQELYDFSASVLSAHSDSVEEDWRIEAIALEVTAFAASRMKLDFRPELVDVLYPITTFLGSPIPQLRRHAITTLNLLAASCGYNNVSDLIVDNADYMVNSVSLRLNTFDISPASTKVVTMMIRLTGPKLIPFLDDVVAAIFAALDNYHGYPLFVEGLFSVLSEVVTQGVKSDMLLLEDSSKTKSVNHKKRKPSSEGVDGILATLSKRGERSKQAKPEEEVPREPFPAKPWGPEKSEAKSLLDTLTSPQDEDPEEEESKAVEESKTPPTPTHTLLTRILSLTQHYLTSPTPTLRKSLLDLVSTVSPALAPDEEAFLPLVHTVWPVVLARLQDSEPYVSIAACKALGKLCESAGDFLGTRFKTEWWGDLGRWVRRVKMEARGEKKERRKAGGGGMVVREKNVGDAGFGGGGGIKIPVRGSGGMGFGNLGGVQGRVVSEGGIVVKSAGDTTGSGVVSALGRFAQANQVWEAVLEMLTCLVGHVKVEDEMFDEILDLVVEVLPDSRHKELREVLEVVNGDAVWLAFGESAMAAQDPEKHVVNDTSSADGASRDEENGQVLVRDLKGRHMQMIAIGGAIGAGLFVGSGGALYSGGPAPLVICYTIVGFMLLFTCQALAELAVLYPVNGAFYTYVVRFLDPAWGFAVGWDYVLSWLTILPFELIAASITIRYWNVPVSSGVWITMFLVILIGIQFFGVRGYGEVEFALSMIKIAACTGFIILGIVINCGGVGDRGYLGTKFWENPGAFKNGFNGFASVFVVAAFSFGGTELVGLAAAESKNPRKAIPKASKQVFWRILFFYVVNLFILGLILPSTDERLKESSGANSKASPFVLAIKDAGIKVLPDIMNGVITLAVISVANSCTFGSTRTMQAMATGGMAPKALQKIDSKGRPIYCTYIQLAFGLLAYIALAGDDIAEKFFTWLLALSGLSYFFIWGSICLTHIRFRAAWKAQGYSLDQIPYRPRLGVYGSYMGLALNILCLLATFYSALWPSPSAVPRAETFFQSYLAAPVVVAFWLFWKVKTGKWRVFTPLMEIDLKTDLKALDPADAHNDVDSSVGMSPWKRFGKWLC